MTGPRPAPEALDPLRGRWVIVAPPRRTARTGGVGRAGTPGVPPADCRCARPRGRHTPEVAHGSRAAGRAGLAGAGGAQPLPDRGRRQRALRRGRPPSPGPGPGRPRGGGLSPDHGRSLARLGDAEVAEVLLVLRDRARVHAGRGAACQVFVNHGPEAGASSAIPTPSWSPPRPRRTWWTRRPGSARGPGCVVCAEIERHRAEPRSSCPRGGRAVVPVVFGHLLRAAAGPRRHRARFEDAGTEVPAVGAALRDGLARLDALLGDPPYNLGVHSRPAGAGRGGHRYVHVWPRPGAARRRVRAGPPGTPGRRHRRSGGRGHRLRRSRS